MDIEATLRLPITLAVLLERSHAVLTDLVGSTDVPELAVFFDRQYRLGALIDPGRRLDAAALAGAVIGDPIVPDERGSSGSVHFEIDVPDTDDGVGVVVTDYHGEEFGEFRGYRHMSVFPTRTSVGVVVAAGVALAAAGLANGEYLAEWMTPEVQDSGAVIERTRLSDGSGDFAARCSSYLRQFPGLRGWEPLG